MIVDDDRSVRNAIIEALAGTEYIVETVSSGKEALLKVPEYAPHLFLINLTLPGMDGLELLAELDTSKHNYEAIVMTGINDIQAVKKSMELGAYGYVSKPFDKEDLKKRVESAINLAVSKEEKARYLHSLETEVSDHTKKLQQAFEIIENREERLDAIISSMDEGLLAVDGDENIMLMNSRAEKLLSIDFSQRIGTHLETSLANSCLAGQLLPLLRGTAALSKEGNLINVDCESGGTKHWLVRISDLRNRTGQTVGRILLFLDQTEKVWAERMRNSFLSVVSHELRTPVNILTNYFSVLRTGSNMEKLVREALEDMEQTGLRLKSMVNNLIQVASLSGSIIDMEQSRVCLGMFVQQTIAKFHAGTVHKGVTFEFQNDAGDTNIETDPRILGIALSALFDNAVKFNKKDGKVLVATALESSEGKKSFMIAITDEGPGIPKSESEILLSGFMQGENPLTRKQGGLGTGLFVAKRSVDILGGEFRIDSAEGKGTTVWLRIPIR